jgi:hypothetical protein
MLTSVWTRSLLRTAWNPKRIRRVNVIRPCRPKARPYAMVAVESLTPRPSRNYAVRTLSRPHPIPLPQGEGTDPSAAEVPTEW